jgi:hypothetical protein
MRPFAKPITRIRPLWANIVALAGLDRLKCGLVIHRVTGCGACAAHRWLCACASMMEPDAVADVHGTLLEGGHQWRTAR